MSTSFSWIDRDEGVPVESSVWARDILRIAASHPCMR